jgi:hypothetical protein
MTHMRQKTVDLPVKEEEKQGKSVQISLEELLASLRSLQDDIGQICELTSEEKRVVEVFFESFLQLMEPFAKTMPVSPEALPAELGEVVQAHLDPSGRLVILYEDGRVDLRDLKEEAQRDLLVIVIKDVMPRFKELTNVQRQKVEERINFLSSVTREMQNISKAFSAATT